MKTAALALLLTLADQLVKAFIRTEPVGHVFLRIEPLLEITRRENTGAAFSLFSGNPRLVTALSLLLLAALTLAVSRMRLTPPARIAAACLLSGGAGNLIDRLLAGQVTDYIRLLPVRFPVFNLADILITSSIAVLIVLMLSGRLDMQETKRGDEERWTKP